MIDWSYETLSHDEKVVWRRLAVFPGAFSMEAAVAVANDRLTEDFVDILDGLVDKSLVSVEIYGGTARYRLLESLRLYALKKLTDAKEAEATKRRHAQYWYGCSVGYGSNWTEAPTAEWLGKHSNDTVGIRAALEWAFAREGDPTLGIRMIAASASLWFKLLLLPELRRHLEHAIQLASQLPEIDDALLMRLYVALAFSIYQAEGHTGEAILAIESALAIAERRDDIDAQVQCIWMRWGAAASYGDYAGLMRWVERTREVLVAAPDHPAAPFLYSRMAAMTKHFWGEQTTALRHAEQVLERAAARRPAQDNSLVVTHQHKIGANMTYPRALWISGRPHKASEVIRETISEMLDHNPEQAGEIVPVAHRKGGSAVRARSAQTYSLGFLLMFAACPVSFWTGDLEEASKYVSLLLEVPFGINFYLMQTTGRLYEQAFHFLKEGDQQHPDARNRLANDSSINPFQADNLSTFSWKLLCPQPLAEAMGGTVNWCTAEILRAKGESLLEVAEANRPRAEELFLRAIDISRRQDALSWELRSATSLARLWHLAGRTRKARALLTDA
jgi:tetratricopeptide (TPR) repeat protein